MNSLNQKILIVDDIEDNRFTLERRLSRNGYTAISQADCGKKALELVKEENNGVLDKKFSIDWTKFKNSIIVTNVEGTKKISTRIFEVIEFNQK